MAEEWRLGAGEVGSRRLGHIQLALQGLQPPGFTNMKLPSLYRHLTMSGFDFVPCFVGFVSPHPPVLITVCLSLLWRGTKEWFREEEKVGM